MVEHTEATSTSLVRLAGMPKVSVLMITYNHEKYIAQAIESALAQVTDFDFEIVIGEDCSTDRTRDIVVDYQRRYSDRIVLVTSETNVGANRNFARSLMTCKGEYIALLEGDDYWTSPNKLQRQVDFLEDHPKCIICFHNATVVDESGQAEPCLSVPDKHPEISTIEGIIDRNFIPTASTLFRRGYIRFPEWLYGLPISDWALHILNAQHGTIGYIDDMMAVYRLHSAATWSSQPEIKRLVLTIKMFDLLRTHADEKVRPLITRTLACLTYDLTWAYVVSGDLRNARHTAPRVLWPSPVNKPLIGIVSLLLNVYAPRVTYILKRVLGHDVATTQSAGVHP